MEIDCDPDQDQTSEPAQPDPDRGVVVHLLRDRPANDIQADLDSGKAYENLPEE